MNLEEGSDNNSVMMVRHKVVLVGDVCVGKTSVMCRFIENKFKESYDVFIFIFIKSQQSALISFLKI